MDNLKYINSLKMSLEDLRKLYKVFEMVDLHEAKEMKDHLKNAISIGENYLQSLDPKNLTMDQKETIYQMLKSTSYLFVNLKLKVERMDRLN